MTERAARSEGKKTHFIAGVWLIWTVIAILSFARHYVEDPHPFEWSTEFWPAFLSLLACFYPWALLTPAIFRLEERFALTQNEWKRRLGIVFLAGLLFSYVGMQIGTVLDFGIRYAFGQPAALGSLWHFRPIYFCFSQFFFWSTFCAGCAIRNFVQFHRQARQAAQLALEKSQLETSLRQAELENLRMRLNPHFLFNTLQNVSVLAQQNPKLASQMLTRLGDLLRAALRRNVSPEATVREEMALTQDYLAVEKMRFGDRLAICVDMAPGSDQAVIPSFLLQPLAENAVIHGLRGVSHRGTITMRAVKEGERLVLTVADNGQGVKDVSLSNGGLGNGGPGEECERGIGLSSTRERLHKMYPGEHEFAIRNLRQGGTEVRIAIPFRRRDRPEETVPEETRPSEQPAIADC